MDKRVARVIELMRGRPERGASPDELAQAVNLSPSRLHQLFKRETGTSPSKYLKALRMEQARELLESSFLSVKEIRARVGEGDESHFTRDFKRAFGVTPTQYRARRADASRASVEATPREEQVPARPDLVSERARQLLSRVSERGLSVSRPTLKVRYKLHTPPRAAQRPAGERLGTPSVLRPAARPGATHGRRVNPPRYRELRRLRLTLGRQPSFSPSTRKPSGGPLRPTENSLPPIP